jgi:hypothetical protein
MPEKYVKHIPTNLISTRVAFLSPVSVDLRVTEFKDKPYSVDIELFAFSLYPVTSCALFCDVLLSILPQPNLSEVNSQKYSEALARRL